ncbi:MAG TPA: hypothetical protein VF928_12305 [Usitatibacteraceae bacterium]
MRYFHRQTGWLSIFANAVGILVFLWAFALVQLQGVMTPMALGLALMLIGTSITFSRLDTEVDGEAFTLHFGLLRWPDRRIELAEIAGALPTRTALLAGWGVRITMRGWLYSVSGREAVIIGLRNGKQFLVGTDDPTGLCDAINGALPQEPVFWQIRGAR